MRRRRHVPPDLTSLFDVLFIVIFAALIRAAAAQHAAAEAAPPPKPPDKPLDPSSLQARALAELGQRPAVVLRVSAAGVATALEANGAVQALDVPLVEPNRDPDIMLSYVGDHSAEMRACRIVQLHLGVPDLSRYLVIIAPERALDVLPYALVEGLRRDVDRCLAEQRGLAVIVDPTVKHE